MQPVCCYPMRERGIGRADTVVIYGVTLILYFAIALVITAGVRLLERRFGSAVEVETAVDATLIGGAVISAGDVVIDGSLRGKLARLQSALGA